MFKLLPQDQEFLEGLYLELLDVFVLAVQLTQSSVLELTERQTFISALGINLLMQIILGIVDGLHDVLLSLNTSLNLSIKAILQKYKDVQIETMEGAAFFQACLTEGVAFSEIRAISNFVEARNRENWMINEAIERLNQFIIDLFVANKV